MSSISSNYMINLTPSPIAIDDILWQFQARGINWPLDIRQQFATNTLEFIKSNPLWARQECDQFVKDEFDKIATFNKAPTTFTKPPAAISLQNRISVDSGKSDPVSHKRSRSQAFLPSPVVSKASHSTILTEEEEGAILTEEEEETIPEEELVRITSLHNAYNNWAKRVSKAKKDNKPSSEIARLKQEQDKASKAYHKGFSASKRQLAISINRQRKQQAKKEAKQLSRQELQKIRNLRKASQNTYKVYERAFKNKKTPAKKLDSLKKKYDKAHADYSLISSAKKAQELKLSKKKKRNEGEKLPQKNKIAKVITPQSFDLTTNSKTPKEPDHIGPPRREQIPLPSTPPPPSTPSTPSHLSFEFGQNLVVEDTLSLPKLFSDPTTQ